MEGSAVEIDGDVDGFKDGETDGTFVGLVDGCGVSQMHFGVGWLEGSWLKDGERVGLDDGVLDEDGCSVG